jgi:hypothetical protein
MTRAVQTAPAERAATKPGAADPQGRTRPCVRCHRGGRHYAGPPVRVGALFARREQASGLIPRGVGCAGRNGRAPRPPLRVRDLTPQLRATGRTGRLCGQDPAVRALQLNDAVSAAARSRSVCVSMDLLWFPCPVPVFVPSCSILVLSQPAFLLGEAGGFDPVLRAELLHGD